MAMAILCRAVVDYYFTRTIFSSPSIFNFLLFAPVWSLLSVAYLEVTPRFMPRASHPYVAVLFELTNAIFYFAGFIAAAVFVGRATPCAGPECAVARVIVVAASLEFVLWCATLVWLCKDVFKRGFRRSPGPVPAPSMRQTETA